MPVSVCGSHTFIIAASNACSLFDVWTYSGLWPPLTGSFLLTRDSCPSFGEARMAAHCDGRFYRGHFRKRA